MRLTGSGSLVRSVVSHPCFPGSRDGGAPAGYDNVTRDALGRQASADVRYSPCARSRRQHGVPGFMMTLEMMQAFFSDTRQKNIEAGKDWSIDEVCRWSFFFVDEDGSALLPVARHMESLGYTVVGVTEPDGDEDPFFYLQVDKLEQHTPESLQARVEALYAIAEQFEIADYDGMNVVAA
ncbi:ribonuclease E inhibitor RraB [Luteimonas terrae]|uniref:Ribonuclease E inhibitor RraB n=2 Tax=Luteimonas terrae TaxID=1530191 RepID=A0A4R5UCP9_9GAMM|nr:ribonuclease E inhibitor RraB [Luteimonas terrae]